MESFMSDFQIFFEKIFSCVTSLWNWLISTTIGEILLFVIIISLFFFILGLLADFKN